MTIESRRELNISGHTISDESDAFVIAEIGHNHQGNIELCERMFQAAARAGATAVKLQKRENKSLYTDQFYNSPYLSENSFGGTYGQHREFLEFNKSEYAHLQKVATELGLIFFATAFDFASADFLLELNVPVIKVASGDLKSAPLISYLSKANIPLIISTGGSTIREIERALNDVNPAHVALLQCTAAYPAEPREMDLRVIQQFRRMFPETTIGLSSHDRGIAFPVVAFALGARIIEKHFTTDRSMKGTDHSFSLEPTGMEKMIRDLHLTRLALGDGFKKVYEKENEPVRKMSKMLVYSQNLRSGELLSLAHFALKSPNDGISPQFIGKFLGNKLSRDVEMYQIVSFEDILES
jgi:N-acetylneuraminate synthase/sialic acid synthase